MSNSGKGRKQSEDHVRKRTAHRKGLPGPKQSAETVTKRVTKNTGQTRSESVKAAMSAAMTGIKKPLLSAKMMGAGNHMYGKIGAANPLFGRTRVNIDQTVYTFQHRDGTIVNMTQYDLRLTYLLDSGAVSKLVTRHPNYKSVKGWSIVTTS